MKKILMILPVALLVVGCSTKPADVITLIERELAYVPYPACPAPNEIIATPLPLEKLGATSTPAEVATAYVKSIAMLKADLGAALSEIDQYKKAHATAKSEELKIKKEVK